MTTGTPVQPSLESLMARYVQRQAEAEALGLGQGEGAEVLPYEAGPVQPIDPKLAWDEAISSLRLLESETSAKAMKATPGWVQLVAQSEPMVAIAYCTGNFPQLVRDFHVLLQKTELSAMKPKVGVATTVPAFLEWADKQAEKPTFPSVLFALAGLRLSKNFDRAERLIAAVGDDVPVNSRSAWDNDRAALAWHQGRHDEALAQWKSQKPSLPVRFNLAMAELFLGRASTAKPALEKVMAELPESGAWHHLARLYHTLSVLRG